MSNDNQVDLVVLTHPSFENKTVELEITLLASQQEIAELKTALQQNDDEIKNSEAVRASIAALVDARTNGLANENNELKAQIELVDKAVYYVLMNNDTTKIKGAGQLDLAVDKSPAQCLQSANQQAIKDAIFNSEKVEFEGSHYIGTYVSLDDLEVNIKQLGE